MGLTVTNLEGLTRVRKRLEAINRLDFGPLMVTGELILKEDNERRALAGLDCNDVKMPPTVREMQTGELKSTLARLETTLKSETKAGKAQRKADEKALKADIRETRKWQSTFRKAKEHGLVIAAGASIRQMERGIAAKAALRFEQVRLNEAEQNAARIKKELDRRLKSPKLGMGTGPPLAPNGVASRVVNQTETASTRSAPWVSYLRWISFDAENGLSILGMHAHQEGHSWPYPKRDVISHPTPTAVRRFREELRRFVRERMRAR